MIVFTAFHKYRSFKLKLSTLNDTMSTTMTHNKLKNSVLAYLALSYFLLLVYASLMPYDFNFATDFRWVFNRALSEPLTIEKPPPV